MLKITYLACPLSPPVNGAKLQTVLSVLIEIEGRARILSWT